ncbi:hypothetical protein E5345_11100 [Propionibacterium sp. NM47_B9-13]|nr:hypothetical protein HMPREF9621_01312 [Cutibacterium modestum HL037PA2]EFT16175.1 hypothetical protein HMPREF9622_00736 [Cutibacterium modestum HL037PA3]EGG27711.1 hypothetical protein PA08_0398 [Cutibacterium modestum P08]REB74521.1 hypothetical protein CP877_01145 [Cutibacterium modestum]TGY28015.1 hypothetical protein E5345_11100 [Propionibacterium sp. NM47_B9-13]
MLFARTGTTAMFTTGLSATLADTDRTWHRSCDGYREWCPVSLTDAGEARPNRAGMCRVSTC